MHCDKPVPLVAGGGGVRDAPTTVTVERESQQGGRLQKRGAAGDLLSFLPDKDGKDS